MFYAILYVFPKTGPLERHNYLTPCWRVKNELSIDAHMEDFCHFDKNKINKLTPKKKESERRHSNRMAINKTQYDFDIGEMNTKDTTEK